MEEKRKKSLQLTAVKPGEKVLLLGAGTGLDLPYLPQDAQITAIDITPEMISRLRRRATKLGMNVDARVMDGQNLDFADNSFDVVILHFVLAVIPDPPRAIKEAERVLRPGGRMVILNKFLKDNSRPSLALRLANKIARIVITDITCKLNPLVALTSLKPLHEETVGLGGFFKIAILEKPPVAQETALPISEPALAAAHEEEHVSRPERFAQASVAYGGSQAAITVAPTS